MMFIHSSSSSSSSSIDIMITIVTEAETSVGRARGAAPRLGPETLKPCGLIQRNT